MSNITHAEFSRLASYLASDASRWAADVLTIPEEHGAPVRDWSMDRFLTNMRERLDHIEKLAKSTA